MQAPAPAPTPVTETGAEEREATDCCEPRERERGGTQYREGGTEEQIKTNRNKPLAVWINEATI